MTRSLTRVAVFAISVSSASAVGKRPAAPLVLVGSAAIVRPDAAHPGAASRVFVDDAAVRPANGVYLLLDTEGTVARLTFVRARDDRGRCPYAAEFAVEEPLARGGDVHLVVVGPVEKPLPKARLMRNGLALAGRAVEPEEPLGAALPAGGATYAVDLDGDGRVDLATVRRRKSGPVVNHAFDRAETEERWERRGSAWSRSARCDWHVQDLVGP